MKTEPEILAKLQNLEIRLITNSTDVNRPLCSDERQRIDGWVDALRWVLDQVRETDKDQSDERHAIDDHWSLWEE